jgi:hypothetical protein
MSRRPAAAWVHFGPRQERCLEAGMDAYVAKQRYFPSISRLPTTRRRKALRYTYA